MASRERTPTEVFPPGEYIRDELEEREWTQADLAEILSVNISTVAEIINAKRNITAEIAHGLADAFGTSAEMWLRLDAIYRLDQTTPKQDVPLRAKVYAKAPVREMVKRGWIEPSSNPEVLADSVCRFFGIASLDDDVVPLSHAARKATSYSSLSHVQVAWLRRVELLAEQVSTSTEYEPGRFDELVVRLKSLMPREPDIALIPLVLGAFGVRFLVVEPLPGSKIDGVTFWRSDVEPVICLSLRYGRVDSIWHTLFHELGHVKQQDGREKIALDIDLLSDDEALDSRPPTEVAATAFAVNTAIPDGDYESLVARAALGILSMKVIANFAEKVGTHPAVVIGRLAHDKHISWSRFGKQLPNVRDLLLGAALTDGWGHKVAPAH